MDTIPAPNERNANEQAAADTGVVRVISEDCTRWLFHSSSRKDEWHLVDLSEWDHSGGCGCEHFQMRIQPLLACRAIRPHSDQAKCKHIRACEKALLLRVKRQLSAQQNQNQNPKRR